MSFSNKLMLNDWIWRTPISNMFESRRKQVRLQEELVMKEKALRETQIRNMREMGEMKKRSGTTSWRIPVRRVLVELTDQERKRLAREMDPIWNTLACWRRACMARWMRVLVGKRITRRSQRGTISSKASAILLLFVHVERDVRLLLHGDDFLAEIPTHDKKWFEGVLFSKYDGKCTEDVPFEWQHLDGNFVLEPCGQMWSRIWWRRIRGTSQMVLRGCGIGKVVSCCDSCGQASDVGRTSAAGGSEASERRAYHVVQVSYNALKLLVPGPSRRVVCCKLPGTRDEECHDERLRWTQSCWTLLERATSWSTCVLTASLA